MTEVTLYIVQEQKVLSHDSYVIFYRNSEPSCLNYYNVANNPGKVLEVPEFVHAPIMQYRTSIYDQTQDMYLAIDPQLKDLLEWPFKQELSETKEELRFAKTNLGKLQDCIKNFNALSLWKRVWASLRGIDPHGATNV